MKRIWSARPLASVAAAVAVALVLTSGAGPTGASRPAAHLDPAFVARVNALCASENALYTKVLGTTPPFPTFNPAKPNPKLLKQVGAYLEKAVPIDKGVLTGLRQLGQPTTGRHAWVEISDDVAQFEALTIEQEKAALAVKPAAFASGNKELGVVAAKLATTALASGFRAATPCAKTF